MSDYCLEKCNFYTYIVTFHSNLCESCKSTLNEEMYVETTMIFITVRLACTVLYVQQQCANMYDAVANVDVSGSADADAARVQLLSSKDAESLLLPLLPDLLVTAGHSY